MPELPPLAQFLRTRRERISPERVGLKPSGRRRTPGLRREEVATLAGVSIDYLVRLEQGRDANPSHDVLLALAEVLQLDVEETGHLVALATVGNSPRMERYCPATPNLDATVAPSVQAMLDRLDPTPAHLLGPASDVLASNPAWRALVAPLGLLDEPNLARHVFSRPEVYVDWDEIADAEVARMRRAQLHLSDDERFSELIAELLAMPAFAERWNGQPVTAAGRGELRLRHPDLGDVALVYESMDLATDNQRLVCWLPADEVAESALEQLSSEIPVSPAQLRVVGEP